MNRNLMTMTFRELEQLEIFAKPKLRSSLGKLKQQYEDKVYYELIWKEDNNLLLYSSSLNKVKETAIRYHRLGAPIDDMYIDSDDPHFHILDGREILPEKYFKN